MIRVLIALVVVLGVACASKQKGEDRTPAQESVTEFQVRPHTSQQLANGLTILWIPDNSLPSISLQLMVKSGSAQDPLGKEGLAALTASMLEKGTAKRNAIQISEDLEQIGAGFSSSVKADYLLTQASSLSFYKDETLELFTDVVLGPTFPDKEIERQRKLALAKLQKLADTPSDFSEYLLPRFLFGIHPYGHGTEGNPGAIRGISRSDVKGYYGRHFAPNNSVLAVVGQYDDAWAKKVVAIFEKWKPAGGAGSVIPEFPHWAGTELLLVDRGDLTQAQIHIGFKGVPRDIPEYMDLRAALKILGESFGSRLFNEIREKRGLTYGIFAWFDPRLKSGPMAISTFTRVDKVGETVGETLNIYRKFVKEGVTDDEVKTVKALMRGQFPRMFETSEALAQQLLILNRYGISHDYLSQQNSLINRISRDTINATIRKYYDPENLRILVYAPKAVTEPVLRKFGKLEIRDYKEFLQ